MDKYSRLKLIFGKDFAELQNAKVLLLGLGGVGSFCLDGLYRSGVENITIVDFDCFEKSNQNRQIGSENLGKSKAQTLHDIYPKTTALHEKIDEIWIKKTDFSSYDLVIDAIDDIDAKVALAMNVKRPFISSMGSAKKLDPTYIKIDSIWHTKVDSLARVFRHKLRKLGFDGDFEVVYSDEQSKCHDMGSFVGVTGSFGLTLCSLAVKTLMKNKLK